MHLPTCPIFAVPAVLIVFATAVPTYAQADDPELKQLYEADQKDRQARPGSALDWEAVSARDVARRRRVRELIDLGRAATGKDYEHAAMVFQHGDTADDILMAHVLAVTAIGKGNGDARWLAAAALDRFLQRMGRPQVFGTQYNMQNGQPWTQEPYNRDLIGNRLRADNCVPDQDYQVKALEAMRRSEDPPPAPRPCEQDGR
jgi:hypothetical protein